MGGRGRDRLYGGGGNDLLRGGAGPDLLLGEALFESPTDGPAGDDRLVGGSGYDQLFGGPGADDLAGGSANDLLDGDGSLSPSPTALERRGADRLAGGPGLDGALYDYRRFDPIGGSFVGGRPPRLTVRLDGRANDGPRNERDDFASDVERAYAFTAGTVVFGVKGVRVNNLRGMNSGLRLYRLSGLGTADAETGLFEGTGFRAVDPASPTAPTQVSLEKSGFGRCRARAGVARAASSKAIHSLKSKAKGHFRTRGRNSSATIRGTEWTITDRCDGTLTTVKSGTVRVRDFRLHKTIVLRAGQSYLARN